MTAPATDHDKAVRFYAKLVALYPRAHRDEFGALMQRTFDDSYRHAVDGERRVGIGFWLAVLWDEGRSIVRERAAEPHGDVLFYALVMLWGLGVLIVPSIPAVSDWRNLVLPTGILAVLFLAIPGRSGLARRFITVVVAVVVVEFAASAAQSIKDQTQIRDQTHLLAPTMLLAGMAFSIKTLEGLNARIVGIKDSVWGREELTYGVLVGLAGVVALAMAVVNTNDGLSAASLVIGLVVPFVCALAGFKSSRRNLSMRSGIYTALGSLLIGATIWFLALPLVVEGALLTFFRDHPAPAATLLPYLGLGPILFWAAIIGIVGAFFGVESTREDRTAPQSASQS
jgi:hypothetical protein